MDVDDRVYSLSTKSIAPGGLEVEGYYPYEQFLSSRKTEIESNGNESMSTWK